LTDNSCGPGLDLIFPTSSIKWSLTVKTTHLHLDLDPGAREGRQKRTDRCIPLCNINIHSIRNKMEFLETSLNDFDILVVTETHLDNQINDSDITLDSFPNIIHRKDLCT
jgi:hypothetical protein